MKNLKTGTRLLMMTGALAFILAPQIGHAQKTKKHKDVPAVFENAHFVYVEAVDGDQMKPGLYPADRQAIFDVQNGLRDWNRYALATRRDEADVVLVVRKGRVASGQVHGSLSEGTRVPVPGGQTASRAQGAGGVGAGPAGQNGDGADAGAEAEMGPESDMLRVYIMSDGKMTGPVWTRELPDGLDAPSLMLLQQLRTAVERAYPSQPPPVKQPTP
jgi:hypothetical protein